MNILLDSNVLIALSDIDHISHALASEWFAGSGGLFATCPVTQGALIRFMLRARAGTTIAQAKRLLARILALPGHEFWPDSVSYLELPEAGVTGYRQVTDAYLVALARHHNSRLATLDRALSAIHSPIAFLIA